MMPGRLESLLSLTLPSRPAFEVSTRDPSLRICPWRRRWLIAYRDDRDTESFSEQARFGTKQLGDCIGIHTPLRGQHRAAADEAAAAAAATGDLESKILTDVTLARLDGGDGHAGRALRRLEKACALARG